MTHRSFFGLSLITTVFLLLLSNSCTDRTIMSALDEADRLLDTHPDSALSIIKHIDSNNLRSKKEKARYSLIKIVACLKLDKFSVADTVWKEALSYYGKSKHRSREAMLAHFAHAAILISEGNDPKALEEFDKAYHNITEPNSELYKGLINLNQSIIYARSFQGKDEIIKTQEGLKHLRNANDSNYLIYGLSCAASCSMHNDKINDAKSYLQEIMSFPNIEKDTVTYVETLLQLGNAYMLAEEY